MITYRCPYWLAPNGTAFGAVDQLPHLTWLAYPGDSRTEEARLAISVELDGDHDGFSVDTIQIDPVPMNVDALMQGYRPREDDRTWAAERDRLMRLVPELYWHVRPQTGTVVELCAKEKRVTSGHHLVLAAHGVGLRQVPTVVMCGAAPCSTHGDRWTWEEQ